MLFGVAKMLNTPCVKHVFVHLSTKFALGKTPQKVFYKLDDGGAKCKK